MTIVVGFLTGDATILLTDSQEVISDYSKTTTQKIQLMNYYGNWRLGIAAAAEDATYATAFCNDLQMYLSRVKEFDHSAIVKGIEAKLQEFYKRYVWTTPKDERPYFQMLIALQGIKPQGSRALFYTHKNLLLPVHGYQSIGIGCHVADFVSRRLDISGNGRAIEGVVYNTPTEEMARFGVFVLDQVKSAVDGCDGETLGAIFYGDGTFRWLLGVEVKEIESWFTAFYNDQLPLLRLVSHPETDDDEFERRLLQFNAGMRLLRTRQARDAQTSSKRFAKFLEAQEKADKQQPERSTTKKSKQ